MPSALLHRLRERLRGGARVEAAAAPVSVDPAPRKLPRLVAEPWYIDQFRISGDRLVAVGWSLPVEEAAPGNGAFTVNGLPFDRLGYPLARPDVGAVLWMREGADMCGFEGVIEHLPEHYPQGVLELRRVRHDTPALEQGRDSWFKPDPALHADLP